MAVRIEFDDWFDAGSYDAWSPLPRFRLLDDPRLGHSAIASRPPLVRNQHAGGLPSRNPSPE
ncbi:MAG: hypothetical protein ACRDHS_16435 [Actinomycetota bacterium]